MSAATPTTVFSFLVAVVVALSSTSRAVEADGGREQAPVCTLEGVLKVHPKFLFRYYLDGFGDGQECALFGMEDELESISVGSVIHVKGRLGTRFHKGGSRQNPSPFPRTCFIFMQLESVEVRHEAKSEQDGAEPPATAPESKPEDDEKPQPESDLRSR